MMRIAIIQDGPVFNNKAKTLAKTLAYMSKASEANAELIVFGESWFSGYPAWLDICSDAALWDYGPVKEIWAEMFDNGLRLDSTEMLAIQNASSDLKINVIIGANESVSSGIGNGTIYNSIFSISDKGELLNHHRKLMPTYGERLVHGHGDGFGLKSIQIGSSKVGSLICWEHWMPLTRQAMHDEGEDIHIALWPQVKELNHVASRQYAFEGRCFVVAVGQIMDKDELPASLSLSPHINLSDSDMIMKGGSAIYGPDGSILLPAKYGTRELILFDLDLSTLQGERMNLSVSGHYNRRDVFQLMVNKNREI